MEGNILDLNNQVEEVKKIEEDLMRQLQEKIEICQNQELNILSLKEDLDKTIALLNTNSNIENNSKDSWKRNKRLKVIHVFLKNSMINKNQEKLQLRDIL